MFALIGMLVVGYVVFVFVGGFTIAGAEFYMNVKNAEKQDADGR
jgi:hypothetical protein